MNQLKTGFILNYVNLGIGALIPFIYTPIMLSILGQEEYGLYKLSSSVTSYLSLLSLGVGSSVTRYLIKYREEEGRESEEKILGLFITIFQVIAFCSLIVGIVLALNINLLYDNSLSQQELSKMKILIIILTVNMVIGFLQTPYYSAINSHERFVFLQAFGILLTILNPILCLIALYMGYASGGLAFVSLLIVILSRIVYYIYVRHIIPLKPAFCRPPKALLKDIFLFSFWLFVGSLAYQLHGATDTILIGMIPVLSTAGVAVYSIGSILQSMVLTMTGGLASMLSPKVNKMVFNKTSRSEQTDVAIQYGRILSYIVAIIVSGFISFGHPFIHFYVGDDYAQAYYVAIVIMVPSIIPLIQTVFSNILVAENKNKFRSLVYLFIAIINIIGTWYLLKIWGIVGAALMTGLSVVIGHGVIMNWFYLKKMGLDIKRFWKNVIGVFMCPVIMSVTVILSYNYINYYTFPSLLAGIVIYSLLFVAFSWYFSMNKYEKELVLSMIRRRKNT